MKSIVVTGALLALTAGGLLAWKATLPQEIWLFWVMDHDHALVSGTLAPKGDPVGRRNLLRSSLLQSMPATLPTHSDWSRDYLLCLQVETSREGRRWRWGWPPLEPTFAQFMDRVDLYYRAGPSPGWQAWYCPPDGQEALPQDRAVERLLDLMESALQDRIARR